MTTTPPHATEAQIGHPRPVSSVPLSDAAGGRPDETGAVVQTVVRAPALRANPGAAPWSRWNLPGASVPAVLGDLVTREITWIGSYRFVDEITDAVQALRDGLHVAPVITHAFNLDRAAQAMAVAGDRTSGSSKVMLWLG